MFCSYCGTKNPDDFRFCSSCGKANPAKGGVSSSSSSDAIYIRKAFISAATEFYQGGSAKGAKTPFDLLDPNWTDRGEFLTNPTTQEVNELVKLGAFDNHDKDFLTKNPVVFVNYLYMISSINSVKIKQGVLFTQELILYGSNLEAFAEEKNWKSYDNLTSDYLNDAREVDEPFYLLSPLVKSAYAKLMMNDRRTAREYLDEFYRIVDNASRKEPAYFGGDNETFKLWIYGCRKKADQLRSKI